MTEDLDARAAISAIQGHEAWAIIRRSTRAGEKATVGVLGGSRTEVASILDVPLETGVPTEAHIADRLVAVPFRQVAERGFEAHDDGTPLVVVDVATELEFSVEEVVAAIDDVPLEFTDRGGFDVDDTAYGELVRQVIDGEIGQGEGANLVLGRHYRARVADWTPPARSRSSRACSSASAAPTGPSSSSPATATSSAPARAPRLGARRRRADEPDQRHLPPPDRAPGAADAAVDGPALKRRLLDFLADDKEIFELFMVVDEELKMMCDVCGEGGQVLGPFLKPMSRLVHTEYLLAGRTDRDPREVLRDTMYAATVTGSPVENACRLIKAHETGGRGYYGAALAIFGRDEVGGPVLDSPIVIRTADVGLDGTLTVTAGATLVRDSRPAYEVAETHAKAGGILSAFGLVPPAPPTQVDVAELVADEDVLLALNVRNRRLSRFWLTDQDGGSGRPPLAGRSAVVLDGEDDFVKMLRHVLAVLGMTSRVVRHEDYVAGALDGDDLVIIGPGPGDPRDGEDPKIARMRAAVDEVLAAGRPFLAVCLGHQTLCQRLGLDFAYKDIVFQGTQSPVEVDGRVERVGFYTPSWPASATTTRRRRPAVRVEAEPDTGDVHVLRGPHYAGIQFHAESISPRTATRSWPTSSATCWRTRPAPGPGDPQEFLGSSRCSPGVTGGEWSHDVAGADGARGVDHGRRRALTARAAVAAPGAPLPRRRCDGDRLLRAAVPRAARADDAPVGQHRRARGLHAAEHRRQPSRHVPQHRRRDDRPAPHAGPGPGRRGPRITSGALGLLGLVDPDAGRLTEVLVLGVANGLVGTLRFVSFSLVMHEDPAPAPEPQPDDDRVPAGR